MSDLFIYLLIAFPNWKNWLWKIFPRTSRRIVSGGFRQQLVQTGKYHRSGKVKIVSRSKPAAKLKHTQKKNLRSNDEWILECARKSTPPEVNIWSTTIYSQQYLALPIPGSRLNTRNSPSACPYCNRQPLKNFTGQTKPGKFNTTKIFHTNYFNMTICSIVNF